MFFRVDRVCLRSKRDRDASVFVFLRLEATDEKRKTVELVQYAIENGPRRQTRSELERVFKIAAATEFAGHETKRFEQAAQLALARVWAFVLLLLLLLLFQIPFPDALE